MEEINLLSDSEEKSNDIITVLDSDTDQKIETNNREIPVQEEEGELSDSGELTDVKDERPIFTISFKKLEDFHMLSPLIIETLQNALRNNSKTYELTIDDGKNEVNAFCYTAHNESNNDNSITNQETGNQKVSNTDDIDYSEEFNALFSIDTEPSLDLEKSRVPSYKRVVKEVLVEEPTSSKKKKDSEKCARPKPACFNCGSGEHPLRECPKPRNIQRINRSKKAFTTKNHERYHIDIEQRYAHFRPGIISDKLQSAMGVRHGELPFMFYRMRTLGYPPGWLEDSVVAHSGMALFNSEGNEVLASDGDEGEIDAIKHKYDASKIIEFPGYNKDPGPNFFDDYRYHNVPPFNPQHLKKEFIKALGEDNIAKGYKRRKMKNLPGENAKQTQNQQNNLSNNECTDMELEDPTATATNVVFTRPLPPSESPPFQDKPPLPPLTQSPNADSPSMPNENPLSPTLADLEAQQEKLLLQLQANTSIATENDDSLIETDTEQTNSNNENINNRNKIEAATSVDPTTPSKMNDIIKESHMGTPLLKFSPFDKLPAGDNFKVGVSDVINFENLPDSTGKYEQMKVVIQKVRTIITKLNNEDDA